MLAKRKISCKEIKEIDLLRAEIALIRAGATFNSNSNASFSNAAFSNANAPDINKLNQIIKDNEALKNENEALKNEIQQLWDAVRAINDQDKRAFNK